MSFGSKLYGLRAASCYELLVRSGRSFIVDCVACGEQRTVPTKPGVFTNENGLETVGAKRKGAAALAAPVLMLFAVQLKYPRLVFSGRSAFR